MAKESRQEVAHPEQTALDDIERLAQEHAGLGTSQREEDKIQAWVKVLHQLSPELNPKEPTFAGPGAAAGDILIAAHSLVIPGDKGFHFQQCGYQYSWVEWPGPVGSSGRPVARHPQKPAHLGGQSADNIGRIDCNNGHQIIETRYHMGLVYYDDMPPFAATIAYSSTGSPVSTHWTNQQWAKKNRDGSLAPTFKYLWHLVSVERSNEKGRWYLLVPKKGGESLASADQFKVGLDIAQKIKNQQLQLADDETASGAIDNIPF